MPTVAQPSQQSVQVVEPHPDALHRWTAHEFGRLLANFHAREQFGVWLNEHAAAEADRIDRVVDGADFLFDLPPRPPCLWGDGDTLLWTVGEALMIVGPQGVGKTGVAGQLMRGALGLVPEVLGMDITPAEGNVMYWAMDRPMQAQRSLARMVRPEERERVRGRLKFWQGPPPGDFGTTPDAILRVIDKHKISSMIVDSIKDATLDFTTPEGGAAYNRTRQILLREGVQLLELHHMTKAGRDGGAPKTLADVFGSGLVTAGAGSVLLLWGKAGDPVVNLSQLKSPYTEMQPMQVLHDPVTGLSTVYHNPDTDLVRLAKEMGRTGITAIDAARAMYGIAAESMPDNAEIEKARRVLSAKEKRGLLIRVEGSGGRGTKSTARFVAGGAAWADEDGSYRDPTTVFDESLWAEPVGERYR